MTPSPSASQERGSGQGTGWLPYQCPSCAVLFRIRRDHIGRIGECPACKERLRVVAPTLSSSESNSEQSPSAAPIEPNRTEAPIAARSAEIMTEEELADRAARRRRKDAETTHRDMADWEREGEESDGASLPWRLIITIPTLVVLGFAAYSFFDKVVPKGQPVSDDYLPAVTEEEKVAVAASMTLTENTAEVEAQELEDGARELVAHYQRFDLAKVREAVRGFLEAKTVEEQARFSRGGESLLPHMKSFYDFYGFETPGYRILHTSKVSYRDSYFSAVVQTADFSDRPIAVELEGNEYRVDWESWVGFCARPVEVLLEKRPSKPFLLRAKLREQNYYNYAFTDDVQWSSWRADFDNTEQQLWIYVKRDDPIYKKFTKDPQLPVVLMARFPPGARGRDQVEVVDYVTGGWVTEKTYSEQ